MLTITIPGMEMFDDDSQEFLTDGDMIVELEHSLVSLSKWEQITEKPFLTKEKKSEEETLLYIKCMIVGNEIPPEVFARLSQKNFEEINNYIEAKMSATWFREIQAPQSSEVITAELIYYWMVTFNIPLVCETWHLNRLFTLIKVTNLKNSPPKKMSPAEVAAQQRELNERRKAQFKTSG